MRGSIRSGLVLAVLLAFVLFAVPGCGGGGGGGGGPAATPESRFVGAYNVSALFARRIVSRTVTATWAAATPDGVGTFDLDLLSNTNGTVTDVGMVADQVYDVDEDGTLHWVGTAPPGVDLFRGALSPDGNLAALGTVADGVTPGFYVFVRPATAYGVGSLSGIWNVCGFSHNPGPPDSGGNVGRITFDGVGGWTSDTWWNVDGTILPPAAGAGTYAVDPDGTFHLQFPGGAQVVGAIHPGGSLIVASGGTVNTSWPTLYVLVRRASPGVGPEVFQGTYTAVGLEIDPDSEDCSSRTGTIVADGAGHFTATMSVSEQAVMQPVEATDGTYSVAADGALVLTPDGGETLQGSIDAGGGFGVLGGHQTALGSPCLYFFLRR